MPDQLLELPERTRKPRQYGLTHVLDKGLGLHAVRDLLDSAADYIDIVKLGWGTSYITQNLQDKLDLYAEYDIPVCCGGTFVEVAIAQGKFELYRDWLLERGFRYVEISSGVLDLSPQEKARYIRRLSEDFVVLAEVGSKDPNVTYSTTRWIEMIERDLEAGAWKVITEARESGTVGIYHKDKSVKESLLADIVERIPPQRLLFEAPNKSQQVWFIKHFGPNVNLGNIAPTEVIPLETLRLGLRGDTMPMFHLEKEVRRSTRPWQIWPEGYRWK